MEKPQTSGVMTSSATTAHLLSVPASVTSHPAPVTSEVSTAGSVSSPTPSVSHTAVTSPPLAAGGVAARAPAGPCVTSQSSDVVPAALELRASCIDPLRTGIFCKTEIEAGAVFGPLEGEKTVVSTSDMDPRYMWEVVDQESREFLYYVNAGDPAKSNWMRHINCARFYEEQNIVCQQEGLDIVFKVIKAIKPGEELLTWFEQQPLKNKVKSGGKKPRKDVDYNDNASPDVTPPLVAMETFHFDLKPGHVMRRGQAGSRYRCEVCRLEYKQPFSLKRHYLRTHISAPYITPADANLCGINAHAQPSGDHLLLYRCNRCAHTCARGEELRAHLLTAHAQDGAADACAAKVTSGYQCTACERTFTQKKELMKHRSQMHPGEKFYACDVCDRKFTCLKNMKRHKKLHSPHNEKCDYCDAVFSQLGDIRRHVREHHQFTCSPCKLEFTSTSDLLQHRVEQHPLKPAPVTSPDPVTTFRFTCTVCKKRFGTYAIMCRHRRQSHMTSTWSSDVTADQKQDTGEKEVPPERKWNDVDPTDQFYIQLANNIRYNLTYHLAGKQEDLNLVDKLITWKTKIDLLDVADVVKVKQEVGDQTMGLSNKVSSFPTIVQDMTSSLDRSKVTTPPIVKAEVTSPVTPRDVTSPPGADPVPQFHICDRCKHYFLEFSIYRDHMRVKHGCDVTKPKRHAIAAEDAPIDLSSSAVTSLPVTSFPPVVTNTCTKCGAVCADTASLHSHIVLCAVDTRTDEASTKSPATTTTSDQASDKDAGSDVTQRKDDVNKQAALESDEEFDADEFERQQRQFGLCYNPLKHVRRRSKVPVVDMQRCTGCRKRFNSISQLERHIKNCEEKESISQNVANHVRAAPRRSEEPEPSGKQQCLYCLRDYSQLTSLHRHLPACERRLVLIRAGEPLDDEWERDMKVSPAVLDDVISNNKRKRSSRRTNNKWSVKRRRSARITAAGVTTADDVIKDNSDDDGESDNDAQGGQQVETRDSDKCDVTCATMENHVGERQPNDDFALINDKLREHIKKANKQQRSSRSRLKVTKVTPDVTMLAAAGEPKVPVVVVDTTDPRALPTTVKGTVLDVSDIVDIHKVTEDKEAIRGDDVTDPLQNSDEGSSQNDMDKQKEKATTNQLGGNDVTDLCANNRHKVNHVTTDKDTKVVQDKPGSNCRNSKVKVTNDSTDGKVKVNHEHTGVKILRTRSTYVNSAKSAVTKVGQMSLRIRNKYQHVRCPQFKVTRSRSKLLKSVLLGKKCERNGIKLV